MKRLSIIKRDNSPPGWMKRGLVMALLAVTVSLVGGFSFGATAEAAGSGGPIVGIAGKCLTNQNGTTVNGNPVVVDDCNSSTQQVWSWTGDKTLRVQGYCLDVQGGGTTPGTPVRLWTCNSSGAQQWRPAADGSLINVPSGLCLETVGNVSTNGTAVQLGTCSGSAAGQDWNVSQAVITLDPPALAPHAPLPGGTPNTPTPTVTADYSMAPEFKDWVDNVAQPLIEDWYPVLADYYTYPDHNAQVWSNLKITIDPTYTSNPGRADWTEGEIVLSADYVRTHMNDGGLVIHEITHLLQFNPVAGTAPLPSWIEEGWADHAREVVYQDRPLRQPVGDERYSSGYSPTSLLLNQAEQANGNNFLKELAKRGWNNTYTDAMFAEVSGASIFKNWYNATNQATSEMNDFVHAVSGKCIDLPSWNTADGTQMHIQTCNGSTAEDWYFKETAAGAKTGLIIGYGDKCIGVIGNATANGTQVAYGGCASASNAGQKWEYVGGTLRNPNSGKCLQPVGGATTNLTKLEIQPCDGSPTQQWMLPTMYKTPVAAVASKVLYPATFPDGQQGIGTTDALGGGYNRILTAPANSTYVKPTLSPNGAVVAYFQTTTGQQNVALRKANADGTSSVQLTVSGYFMTTSAPRPLWSTDNSKVLVATTPNGQTATDKQWTWLWVNADGSGQQVVSASVIGGTPFAAAGGKIYFANDGASEQQLCSVSDTNGTGEVCFGSAMVPKSVALSPDSSRVASLANGTTTSIQITTVSGGMTSSVSLSGLGGGLTNVEEVAWVPNTTKVAFRAVVSGKTSWYAIDAVSPGQISKLNVDASSITWYASAAPTLKHGSYNALTPGRITDTRTGSGELNAGKTLTPGGTLDIQVAGLRGVPAEGASAVVLNITEAATTSNGYVTVYPTGTTQPNASTLNNTAGKILNNQTTVGLGADGKVSIFNQLGNTDMVVDVVGYYSETGGSFTPTAPKRVIDTRDGGGAPVAAWDTKNVQVTGVLSIPSGATGIVADITEVGATGTGYLTVYPAGASLPAASNMNFSTGETLTKEVSARLSAGGALTVYNGSPGTTHFIVDVVGYYTNDMSGMAYTPINPSRIADTRAGSGQPYAGQTLTSGMTKLFTISSTLMPANATSVVNNLTVPASAPGNYLTVFPSNVSPTGTSITQVSPVAFNQTTVQLSSGPSGGFKVYNNGGNTDVILDSLGYYY